MREFRGTALYIRRSTVRRYNIAIFAPDRCWIFYGSVLRIFSAWRNALGRHPKLYAWIGLSIAMTLVILITSLGARPGPLQMLFLALVGVLLAGATVVLIDWEDRGGPTHENGGLGASDRDLG